MKLVSVRHLRQELRHLARLLKPLAKEAYVFGSVAKEGAVPLESDLDVLVVPKTRLSYSTLYEKTASALDDFLALGLAPHLIIASKRHEKSFLQSARLVRIV